MPHGPNCGAGEFEIIAAILGRAAIEKFLGQWGSQPQTLSGTPARQPGLHQAA